MSTAALAERPIVAVGPSTVTNDQLDLIRRTIAKDATPDELKLYLYDCQRQGVHPLDKLIHFTKRSGKYTPITSIDFMRIRAAETGEYAGSDDATFAMLNVRENEAPVSATVTVWRLVQGQRCSFTATARWSEYKPEQNDFMWRKMPHTMLGKCAEALALRKGFPRQLAGLYAKEELDQADSAPAAQERPREAVGPNGGEHLATFQIGASGDPSDPMPEGVDATTGEELPAPPPGFYYVRNYRFNSPWHEAELLEYDVQGGALKVSTKTKIGTKLEEAQDAGIPVSVEVAMKTGRPGEAYLNRISLLAPAEKAF